MSLLTLISSFKASPKGQPWNQNREQISASPVNFRWSFTAVLWHSEIQTWHLLRG